MNCFYCKEPIAINSRIFSKNAKISCFRCAPLAEYDEMVKRVGVNPAASPTAEGVGGQEVYHKLYDLHNPNRVPSASKKRVGHRKGFQKQPDGTWKKVSNDYIPRKTSGRGRWFSQLTKDEIKARMLVLQEKRLRRGIKCI